MRERRAGGQAIKGCKDSTEEKIKIAFKNAHPVTCMEAWEAEGREITYIASETYGELTIEYYEDDHGDFWYKNKWA